ncbi:molecular chaperone MKKS [Amia ocellicauda]|uniref:molecular chaperone MKKS n=1 Tax=Amia ocellicauda TaxID=2972642 RepID=UPI0034643D3F
MSRLSKKEPSLCTAEPLKDGDVCRKLAVFKQMLASCFGPRGRLKQIHNNVGGQVQTTSTCAVLLKGVPMSHPILKLLAASVSNHVSRFSDCGLFAAILSCSLIEHAQRLGVEASVVMRIYKHVLGVCVDYLSHEECGCKVCIDFSSSHTLLSLARSVITSKPACMVTSQEALHISSLVVQAFLQMIPCETGGSVRLGKVVLVSIEGHGARESAMFPGLMVDMPETLASADLERLDQGQIKMVLFSVSLSGDLSETGEGTVEVGFRVHPETAILYQLLRVGEKMVSDRVDLFACQKVVHPVLKQYLKEHHVVVIDRLGISLMEPLTQMTGAQPIATIWSPVPAHCYGQLSGLRVQSFGSKQMLNLVPAQDSAVCSLVLCHRNETMLSELKVVCQSAEHILRLTLRNPFALLGGGCMETHLAAYIRSKCCVGNVAAWSELGCSRSEYLLTVESFCHSLEVVARSLEHDGGQSLTDLSCGHRWVAPDTASADSQWKDLVSTCGCGWLGRREGVKWAVLGSQYPSFTPMLTEDGVSHNLVLDSFPAKLNALQVAVETANLIVDLQYIVQDVN